MRKGWMAPVLGDGGWLASDSEMVEGELPCYVFTEEEMEALVERVAHLIPCTCTRSSGVYGHEKACANWARSKANSIVMGEEHG